MLSKLNKRIVLFIRSWLRIENKEHRHWCHYMNGDEAKSEDQRCYHSSICWYCTDPFCAEIEKKGCPNCEAGKPKTCKGKMGQYGPCTCGFGRG